MAGNGSVIVPPDSTGKNIDCASLSAGGVTVYRQRVVIADGTRSANFAVCSAGSLQTIVTNTVTVSGQVSVTGSVAISNNINISAMPAVVNAAGTNNIGFINNISAPVALAAGAAHIGEVNISLMPAVNISTMPSVVLATGTNEIGSLKGISATVNVSVTNQVNIGNISATVNVAGTFTIGTIDKISATATVVCSGYFDISAGSTNTIRVGDSANSALRVNVVAGGVGGGIMTGPTAQGSSASAGIAPVMVGGNDSAGGGIVRVFLTDSSGRMQVGGQVSVTGSVAISNTVTITGQISVTGGVVLNTGTNNIGTINNISAAVVLAAGANNIGTINNISAAVVLAAGAAHVGEVNISLMPTVNVNLAAQSAGFSVIVQGTTANDAAATGNPVLSGGVAKDSAGTMVTVADAAWMWVDRAGRQITQMNAASQHPSATHGPKSVTLSASANTVLVASAGAACVYVDSLIVTSNLAANTRCDVYETASSAAPEVSQWLAASGGGYTMQFNPPWKISAGQALSARLKPSASAQVLVTVHFHVGAT